MSPEPVRHRLGLGIGMGLMLALSGCDGGEPTTPVKQVKVENPYHDQLKGLSEPMQRLGLMRAIRDSGNRCKKVEAGAYQEDYEGMPMWVARCSDSGAWAVFIAPNADIQVRACEQTAQLDLPECRMPESGETTAG